MPELVFSDSEFNRFSKYVQSMAGINLHEGKKELVKARLGKILRQRDCKTLREYCDHIVHDRSGHELTTLLNSISTNLTYFFREPQHFEFLAKWALPEIVRNKRASRNGNVRCWSAGCSSGEEAYSIAITVIEALTDRERLRLYPMN
jgi:chemotaxis protein methyltransferase CheR